MFEEYVIFWLRQSLVLIVAQYLDEFSKSLAAEVRMLLAEVGKLREERRNLQQYVSLVFIQPIISDIFLFSEMGYLLCMRSKYGPGGEFDPEW